MKTSQMLFVAIGGMFVGAAGTLAVQTGLVHYEISLDIRPRGAATTLPPPALASTANDPYLAPSVVQNWEPVPSAEQQVPVTLPLLDDQQIAEIVALREQIRGSSDNGAFAEHLRTAAGLNCLPAPTDSTCPECCEEPSPLASGLHQPVQR